MGVGPLTPKQRRVLDAILRFAESEERTPSTRELAAELRCHVKTVYQYLLVLKRKGYVSRRRGHIRLADGLVKGRGIPIVGQIAAGTPISAVENREGALSLRDLFGEADLFAVKVVGDSMRGAGILAGDFVIVRRANRIPQGGLGVCYVGEEQEATVKRFYDRPAGVELVPENPAYPVITIPRNDPHFRIGGEVAGVVRRM